MTNTLKDNVKYAFFMNIGKIGEIMISVIKLRSVWGFQHYYKNVNKFCNDNSSCLKLYKDWPYYITVYMSIE